MLTKSHQPITFEASLHFVLKSDILTVLVTHKLPIEALNKREAYQLALMEASQTIDNHNINTESTDIMEYIGISALDYNPTKSTLTLSQKMLDNEKELLHLIQKLRMHNLNIQQDLAQTTL